MIQKFNPGDEDRTILDCEAANELVDANNAFLNLKIIPEGAGTLTVAGDTAVLDLGGQSGDVKIECAQQEEDGSFTPGVVEVSGNFIPYES